MLGVDAFYEPWLEEQLALFVRENVSLIKKATNPATIEEATIRGFRQGKWASAIAKDITGVLDRTQRQLELIARDQISKLNGELTKLRQTSAGIVRYVWRTSLDERVRVEHREREGKTFRWGEGDCPGFDIGCRCWSEPVVD